MNSHLLPRAVANAYPVPDLTRSLLRVLVRRKELIVFGDDVLVFIQHVKDLRGG